MGLDRLVRRAEQVGLKLDRLERRHVDRCTVRTWADLMLLADPTYPEYLRVAQWGTGPLYPVSVSLGDWFDEVGADLEQWNARENDGD